MGELGFCRLQDITSYLTQQLIADIHVDSGISLLLVRLLHNKILYAVLASLRCYLSFLDIVTFTAVVPFFLLPLILYALLAKRWRKVIWFAQLLLPIFFIVASTYLTLPQKILIYRIYYGSMTAVGLCKLILNHKLYQISKKWYKQTHFKG